MGLLKFEDLDVWKRSCRVSVGLYRELSALKDFGFRDQITRSGLSVPSNIAEGMERAFPKEKCRYLDIALGSNAELRTQIMIGMEIGYIDRMLGKQWVQETREISAMLAGLKASIADN